MIFDLAVVVNDWCVTETGEIDAARYQSLIKAYAKIRPFVEAEKLQWPLLLKICAMRFWLSRLLTKKRHLDGKHELMDFKDPEEFKRILQNHFQQDPLKL